MAESDGEESAETPVSPEEFRALQKRARLNKGLLITVLIVCCFIVAIMGTGISVLFMKVSTLNDVLAAAEEESMQQQFDSIDEQILLLADFRKAEMKKLTGFTDQLKVIAGDCSDGKVEPYKKLLLEREQDFQKMLSTINTGTRELASMSKGSKKWLAEFDAELTALKSASSERSKSLESL